MNVECILDELDWAMEGESALTVCPVCLTEMKNPKLLPCTHSLCLTCVRTLAGNIIYADFSNDSRSTICKRDLGLKNV